MKKIEFSIFDFGTQASHNACMLRTLALLLCAPAMATPTQFWARLGNPSVEVGILHPPDLGLKVSRVTFAPAPGHASRELADWLVEELLRGHGLEIVAPGNAELLARAQDLAASGYMDPAMVAQLAQRLGPSALVAVNVSHSEFKREETARENKDRDGKLASTTRTLTTTLDFEVGIQVVDLASGRVFGAVRIHETPSAATSSDKGKPAPPDERLLQQQAFAAARDRVLKLITPWTEVTKQIFFDDKAYRMDQAASRMEAHDLRGALALAAQGADEAEADAGGDAKKKSRAVYNLGLVLFAQGDPSAAIPKFHRALEILPDASIFKDALRDAQRAADLREPYRRYERSADTTAKPVLTPETPVSKSKTPEERLEDLDRLHKKGLLTEEEYQAKRAEILKEL